jgi:hypothetical protein
MLLLKLYKNIAEKNVLYLSGFGGDSITILSDTGRDDGASIGTHALA